MKNTPSWLSWVVATLTAAVAGVFTLMSYSYNNFATIKEVKYFKETINSRLDRIEDKIDRILTDGRRRDN